ncbi:phosphate butyryltransferase [Clostridium amylolyticum]|uniref:Phosphate butyryltransferase n=1 Tax=Clostridium amylolyticum TaxID=1121298 RepID=A0A1M6KMW9_9CLOT|nr:bifunctional enoyl-CoA hydratase/phosphate acetyltransferase [Clostridium amylolyticum]SHJ60309.1 phosphate butyryltransferase [Clostridium amylolyticum]
MNTLDILLKKANSLEKKRLAVAVAEDSEVLKAVYEAVNLGIITAKIYGNEVNIRKVAEKNNIDLKHMEIKNVEDEAQCALEAVKSIRDGENDFLMKGKLNTADLLRAVLHKEYGIRKNDTLSHVMVYQVPNYHKLLFLTDGGMVTFPELKDKVGIINNALSVCKAFNIETPKVAALAAIENVNTKMQSTVDAASLAMMNKRGQIKGCIIDGPLAFDNAINLEAAKHKGVVSQVAGDADVLLVPNIECGNMVGKCLTYFAGSVSAGVIVGAKCPIVLVSRADTAKSKLYSIALGAAIG